MKFPQILFVLILSLGAAFVTVKMTAHQTSGLTAQESTFDRIARTNTLRCGYAIATPWMMVDPKTNQLTGVDLDVTNALAEKIGVKVEWVEETGWGVAEQGLIGGRYDMLCGSVCVDPKRDRAATFSTPFLSIPLLAVVRSDDHRFDGDISKINTHDVRIGVKNGHVFEYTANERFPAAQKVYANDISDDTEFLEMLKDNKIDIAFTGQSTLDDYTAKNPGVARSLSEPVRFCEGAFLLPAGDERLKHMVDDAVMELNSNGRLNDLIGKYVKLDPRYVRLPALPYEDKTAP